MKQSRKVTLATLDPPMEPIVSPTPDAVTCARSGGEKQRSAGESSSSRRSSSRGRSSRVQRQRSAPKKQRGSPQPHLSPSTKKRTQLSSPARDATHPLDENVLGAVLNGHAVVLVPDLGVVQVNVLSREVEAVRVERRHVHNVVHLFCC